MPLRQHWKTFTSANGGSAALDAHVLDQEKQLLQALEAGDFQRAATLGQAIETAMRELTDRTTTEFAEQRKSVPLHFVPRATPCPTREGGGEPQPRPMMRSAANPDDFFPAESVRQGEMGKVVLRARIAASNCATEFAVLVHSGYPDLDAAAIKVAENSLFTAAVVNGEPRPGEMSFAVNFVYNRRPK
jgi:TonB family protein